MLRLSCPEGGALASMAGVKRALPFLIFLSLACATRLPILHYAVLDWDESLYFIMAQQWHAGHLPYTTVWDNKPLGIYVIFAAFQALIPGVAAMRVATALCVALLAAAVFRITGIITRERQAGWIAGGLLVICSLSNDGLSANTELFMAAGTTLAVLAVLTEAPAWAAGLALGCGFMIKYVMVPEAFFVLLLLYHRRGGKDVAIAVAAAALPVLAAAGLYAATGHLALWWDCSVLSNFRRAGAKFHPGALGAALSTQFWRWGPLYLTAFILAFGVRRRGLASNFPLLWLLGALLGAASAKSFYDHYFLQALPALCVLAGIGFARLPTGGAVRDVFCAFLASLPLHAGWQALRYATGPDLPAEIAATLTAAHAQSLYIFDSEPIIYPLTGLPAPTRFVLPSELMGLTLPQVAGVNPVAEVARILGTKPQYIVRRAPPPGPDVGNPQVYAVLDAALAAHYALVWSWPGAGVYKREPE
jgi:4-amino-4-deoxy-L-arabinose transferase-like glycosyltransferase